VCEPPERPFADPSRTVGDLAVLRSVRARLRARAAAGGGAGCFRDADGAEHWLVVPDWAALEAARPAAAVGFFGQARDDVDHAPLVALEHEVVARAAAQPGLLAYHNVRFASGQWGNLVVLAARAAADHVRGDERHQEAIRRTAAHYHSLRLHRLTLPDGALGDAAPVLEETLLVDLGCDPPWRAVRPAAGACL
jgi:hypothetical protein